MSDVPANAPPALPNLARMFSGSRADGPGLSLRLAAAALPALAVPFVMAIAGATEAVVVGTTACIVLSHRLAWRMLVAPPRRDRVSLAVRLAGRDRDLAAAQLRLAAVEEDAECLAGDATSFTLRLGRDRKPRFASPGCRAVLGVSPPTILARGLDVVPADAASLDAALTALGPGETRRLELPCRRGDGRRVLLRVALCHIGERGFLLGARDITGERRLETQVAELTRRLDAVLFEDRLTRLANRARLDAAMVDARARARRLARPLALVAVRVAHHRAFVDRYGTIAADSCLRRVARTLAGTIRRPTDLAVRSASERFWLLLPDTDTQGAAVATKRVIAAVAALGMDHAGSPRGVVEVRARAFMLHAAPAASSARAPAVPSPAAMR